MPTAISLKEIRRLRLTRQLIERSAEQVATSAATPAAAVSRLLAIQAQDFGQALWAISLRSNDCPRESILDALTNGSVIRSSLFRGTLMFLRPEDLRWMLSLTAERTLRSMATRHRALGLDEPTFDRAREVAHARLSGGRTLSREGLFTSLGAAGIATDGQRGYHIIWNLAQRGVVCWGPPSGTKQALVLVDEWVTPSGSLNRDEALARLATRYFAGHGPATERDLSWWSGLTLSDARRAIAVAGDDLVELSYAGSTYLARSKDVDTAASTSGTASATPDLRGSRRQSVHALPGFDEWLLGYQDRSVILQPGYFERIVPGRNGIFLPMIVVNGEVVGTWRQSKITPTSTSKSSTEAKPFKELNTTTARAFEDAAGRYGQFCGRFG